MTDPRTFLPLMLALASLGLVIWSGNRKTVSPLITLSWAIHLSLWSVAPLLLQPFLAEAPANSAGLISRNELAILHGAGTLILALVFLGVRRPLLGPPTAFFDRCAPSLERLFMPTLAATAFLVLVELNISRVSGSNFKDSVELAISATTSQAAESGLWAVLLGFAIGYPIALISLGRRRGVPTRTLALAWIAVFIFSGFSISRGARAMVLLPLVVGLVALTSLRGAARKRATTLVLGVGLLTVVLGSPVAIIMGFARGGVEVSTDLIRDAATALVGDASIGQQAQLIAQEAHRKFDDVGPGVELLAMEPPGTAGLAPILSASASPIPRALYATKPVPTSRDGTNLGVSYRIAAKAYGNPDAGMVVPVSSTAIALWEFGALGPLALIIANLLNLILLNSVLISQNVLARAVGISFLGLPTAEFVIAPDSMLLQNNLRMMLFLAVLALVFLLWDALFKAHNSTESPTAA